MANELLKEYVRVAEEKYKSAQLLFDNARYEDAVSRAYYAAFHCAQALLLSKGLKAETHSGVKSLFGLHFINNGELDKKFGKYLRNLKDDRESGDYDIMSLIDKDDAETALIEAKEFIAETKKYLGLT